MPNIKVINQYLEEAKKESTNFNTLKEFCSFYERYFYVLATQYTTDTELVELLNQVGDELMKEYLDFYFVSRIYSQGLFDIFMTFDNTINLNFSALEQRISNGSILLNQSIYRTLLEAFKSFCDIRKKYQDLSEKFSNDISRESTITNPTLT